MGQISIDWDRRWKVCLAYQNEMPSDEDLKTIKALVFTGSSHAEHEKDEFV